MTNQLESIDCIMDRCEAHTWQVVSIQLHLRLKFVEISDIQSNVIAKQENVKEELNDEADQLSASEDEMDESSRGPFVTTESWSCSHCAKSFTSESALASHLPMHSDLIATHRRKRLAGVKRFKCDWCHGRFATPSALCQHNDNHIRMGKRANGQVHRFCRQISEASPQKRLRECRDSAKPYVCNQCDANFATMDTLIQHRILEHSGGIRQKRSTDKAALMRCIKGAPSSRSLSQRFRCDDCDIWLSNDRFRHICASILANNELPVATAIINASMWLIWNCTWPISMLIRTNTSNALCAVRNLPPNTCYTLT